MIWLIVGIILGFIIGVITIEWLLARIPRFFNRVFTWLDGKGRKIDVAYYNIFDQATSSMCSRGWFRSKYAKFMLTAPILKEAGVNRGRVLEIGSGPGYLGLEWLNSGVNAHLVGLDHSPEMVNLARHNAVIYKKKPDYLKGDAHSLNFADGWFDGAFSSASMHEWDDPVRVLSEVKRVLQPGAPFVIADLRRDVSLGTKLIVKFIAWPSGVRRHFSSSFDSAYTVEEVEGMLRKAGITDFRVEKSLYTLIIRGKV